MANESQLLHHVKLKLNGTPSPVRLPHASERTDLVKKRMHRDGHLTADTHQYLRDRRGDWCIYDDQYEIRDAGQEYTRLGKVRLRLQVLRLAPDLEFKDKGEDEA